MLVGHNVLLLFLSSMTWGRYPRLGMPGGSLCVERLIWSVLSSTDVDLCEIFFFSLAQEVFLILKDPFMVSRVS